MFGLKLNVQILCRLCRWTSDIRSLMEPFSKPSSHGVKYFEVAGVSVRKSGINEFMKSVQKMCADVPRLQCDACA